MDKGLLSCKPTFTILCNTLLLEVWTNRGVGVYAVMPDLGLNTFLTFLCHLSKIFSPSKPQLRDGNSTHCVVIVGEVIQDSA